MTQKQNQHPQTLNEIADTIIAMARQNLETDPCCQGGLSAKIHAVYMQLVMELKDRIKE